MKSMLDSVVHKLVFGEEFLSLHSIGIYVPLALSIRTAYSPAKREIHVVLYFFIPVGRTG